jgi:hypothetical protein
MLTSGRTRHRRVLPVFVAALAAVTLLATVVTPSQAAGTGGIEVTPVPSMRNGKAVTTFTLDLPTSGSKQVPYTLRNVDAVPRTARVFAAKVTLTDGTYALGAPGSSPYVSSADQTVTLAGRAVKQATFRVAAGTPPGKVVYAAIVVEVRNGSVVQNAATLITLRAAPHRIVGLPTTVVVVALLALVLVALGLLLVVFRRRSTQDRERPATPVG